MMVQVGTGVLAWTILVFLLWSWSSPRRSCGALKFGVELTGGNLGVGARDVQVGTAPGLRESSSSTFSHLNCITCYLIKAIVVAILQANLVWLVVASLLSSRVLNIHLGLIRVGGVVSKSWQSACPCRPTTAYKSWHYA
jgi:hypothetical protein